VDCFKFLPLNSPGVNERINEVKVFIIVILTEFFLNTKTNSYIQGHVVHCLASEYTDVAFSNNLFHAF
jgi:hypothetical protein